MQPSFLSVPIAVIVVVVVFTEERIATWNARWSVYTALPPAQEYLRGHGVALGAQPSWTQQALTPVADGWFPNLKFLFIFLNFFWITLLANNAFTSEFLI